MQGNITFELIYEGESHTVSVRRNEYVNLMMLIYDQFADEEFGDCRGMGKCGTCMIQVLNQQQPLSDYGRNETVTLAKMNASNAGVRLSCQLLIDERLNGLQIRVI